MNDLRGKPGETTHVSHKRFRRFTQSLAQLEDQQYNKAHTFQHQLIVLGDTSENKRRLLGLPSNQTIYFTNEGIRQERDKRPLNIVAEPLIIPNNHPPISRPSDLMSIRFDQPSTPQLLQTRHPVNIGADWVYTEINPEGFVIDSHVIPNSASRRRRNPQPDVEENRPPVKTLKLEQKTEKQ